VVRLTASCIFLSAIISRVSLPMLAYGKRRYDALQSGHTASEEDCNQKSKYGIRLLRYCRTVWHTCSRLKYERTAWHLHVDAEQDRMAYGYGSTDLIRDRTRDAAASVLLSPYAVSIHRKVPEKSHTSTQTTTVFSQAHATTTRVDHTA
jgi:hypothetical protein